MPYEYEELTIENIRKACQKHFAVDGTMTCDVLAGEQGPSCNSVKQIPDTKVIHVRFVERVGESDECEGFEAARVACHGGKSPPAKRRFSGAGSTSEALNKSQPVKTAPSPSKFVPRSLSLVEMLKLGKVFTQSTTSVDLYTHLIYNRCRGSKCHLLLISQFIKNRLLQEVPVKHTKQ